MTSGARPSIRAWRRRWTGNQAAAYGAVEAQGWQLEHVATAYVARGEDVMEQMGGAAAVAYHGELVALYVFRRTV